MFEAWNVAKGRKVQGGRILSQGTVVTKKVLNKSKYILYLRLYKVAILCLDVSFAHSLHSLNQLHEVVTWNAFQLISISFPS